MKTKTIIVSIFLFVLVSTQAFALLDCRVATFRRNAANQDYQDALVAAVNYAGGDREECAELWNAYKDSCEYFGSTLMVFWYSCLEPTITNPVLQEAREMAFEGNVEQMIDECYLDLAEALAVECY